MLTVLILCVVTVAGYFDLRWHRVPNWLVALTIALALSWHTAAGGVTGFWSSLAGLLVGLGILFPLFLLRGMGAGDVKFFGALGAAVTHHHVFTILLTAFAIAALSALYQAFRNRALRQTMANVADIGGRMMRGHFGRHPVVDIDNRRALLVHFTLAVAIATWIFVILNR